jgi:hypothetical protein
MNWFISAELFARYGSRLYVTTRELMTDLARTNIKGLDMPSLKWPLKSFGISFPRESVFLNDTDGYLTGMLVALDPGEEDLKHIGDRYNVNTSCEPARPKFIVCSATSSGAAYSCNTYLEDFSLDALKDLEFKTTLASGMSLDSVDAGDRDTSKRLMEVFVKVLSYMNARPADLEEGALKARAKRKGRKAHLIQKQDWWKPWIIGLDRKRQVKILAGTNHNAARDGSSPIPHWRCGHWRHVRHGKGLENSRITWIEPTIVNRDKSL